MEIVCVVSASPHYPHDVVETMQQGEQKEPLGENVQVGHYLNWKIVTY